MRTLIIALGFIFSIVSFAETNPHSLKKELLTHLPQDLQNLSTRDSASTLQKKFSSRLLPKKDPSALYLHYSGDKNDVTIGLKNGYYDYLLIQASTSFQKKYQDLFQTAYRGLSSEEKALLNKPDTSHDGGRTVTLTFKKEGLALTFWNNSAKTLKSVLFYGSGELP